MIPYLVPKLPEARQLLVYVEHINQQNYLKGGSELKEIIENPGNTFQLAILTETNRIPEQFKLNLPNDQIAALVFKFGSQKFLNINGRSLSCYKVPKTRTDPGMQIYAPLGWILTHVYGLNGGDK